VKPGANHPFRILDYDAITKDATSDVGSVKARVAKLAKFTEAFPLIPTHASPAAAGKKAEVAETYIPRPLTGTHL
jgi:hypothetical protein